MSWTNASRKQCKKLLEIIGHLAEDDNGHAMAHKTLPLLWNLTQSDDVPVHIVDLALSAHIKIHNYSCSQVRLGEKHNLRGTLKHRLQLHRADQGVSDHPPYCSLHALSPGYCCNTQDTSSPGSAIQGR